MIFSQLQYAVSELVSKDGSSVSDYLSLFKQLTSQTDELPYYFRKIRVAFLSNFTLLGLPEVFRVRALAHNIWAETYLGPYNQYAQEILNTKGNLYKFQPKLIYFLVDFTDANEKQINELVSVLYSKGIAIKLVWGSAIKEKFPDHWHTKYKELGDLRLAPQAFPDFVEQELIGEAVAMSGATKKCLVVDLDNTLWAGVVGEDGWGKVAPDKELQSHIKRLCNEGVVLAINSKNNEADALEVLDKHPEMILRKDHFAARRINWQDKVANMIELAQELNLGLDSFVFIDDDPFQRVSVKTKLPEVAVLSPDNLKSYPCFCSFSLTEEDKKRGQMYAEENRRKGFLSSLSNNTEDFLEQLGLEVEIGLVSSDDLARVSQLTQKTNQFNLTTRRYSEQDIENLIESGWHVWAVSAKDKFGEYGIIGVGIVEPKTEIWRIDTFLLSCRILGREIEKAFLTFIVESARSSGVKVIEGEFIPAAKNEPCRLFYKDNGFDLVGSDTRNQLYRYVVAANQRLAYPKFLRVLSV